MRLLYVIDSLAPGGAETSLVEMAPGLIANGISLHVLPLLPILDLAPALETVGAIVHKHGARPSRPCNVHRALQAIQRINPDLVHTTLYEADIAGRTAAVSAHVPSSTSIVGDSYGAARQAEVGKGRLRLARAVDRVTIHRASRVHAVSHALAESVTLDLRVRRSLIDVIPRGRDPQKYAFRPTGTREKTRSSLSVPHGAPVILTVGRLDPAKGLLTLIRALPRVAAIHPDVVVLLAGKDGRSSRELKRAASGMSIDIRFLGHNSDVAALLAAADVLCFPSMSEGSPGTLIEAIAVGCPIVASDIAANREVLGVGDQAAGVIVTPGNHHLLANALIGLLTDPSLSHRFTSLGRGRFDRLFTIDVIASRMTDFFHRAGAGPDPQYPMSRLPRYQ